MNKPLLLVLALGATAHADVTRTEVIARAKAYTYYPWRSTSANQTASCTTGYTPAFPPGDYIGVAYNWGGFDSLFQFSQKIASGYGAGNQPGTVLSCTTGVDCSGFVSRAWATTTKYGTSTLSQISTTIAAANLLPGDAFNDSGTHVTLFAYLMASGEPFMYEAGGYSVRENGFGGWSWVSGYAPIRYNSITGTTVSDPAGTFENPIDVPALPFSDSRDTRTAPASVLDGCAAAPTINESGPEYVYRVQITQPGQLTVSSSDDVNVDIDVHLYTSASTSDCVARADSTFTHAVDCGTYYVVADTFNGIANAGPFDLMITETPNGQPCGSGPPTYAPLGKEGDACGYPGDMTLPPCNPTLGGDICIYTSGANPFSFCSVACTTDADCTGLPGGGCCQDLGSNELYCVEQSLCAGAGSGSGTGSGSGSDPGSGAGSGSGDGSGFGDQPGGGSGGGCAAGGEPALASWLVLLGVIVSRRSRRR